ncbi:hypothetical protein PoB_004151000 [Plakobranchus ocellatus]|uniref:Uncharacterized protein n=1 Tax=Plakobranchus ocellatus TaxID=259542 RepID=A0AAV4B5W5_9GAST|nr:hypothetical protein PoB_004151000 [Plakobranchus ocellatus]
MDEGASAVAGAARSLGAGVHAVLGSYLDAGTCLLPALIDDPRCGQCIITKSQSPQFTGGLGAAWLGRMN